MIIRGPEPRGTGTLAVGSAGPGARSAQQRQRRRLPAVLPAGQRLPGQQPTRNGWNTH